MTCGVFRSTGSWSGNRWIVECLRRDHACAARLRHDRGQRQRLLLHGVAAELIELTGKAPAASRFR